MATRSSPNGVTVELVSPSGVVLRRFADGPMLVRIAVGQLDHPDQGLLVEMTRPGEPPPFESAELQQQALASVERMQGLEADERRRMRQWIEYAGHLDA
ncbi:MAG: hypothetical protein AAGH41_09020 [Pseudomonadota bacterium]